MMTIAFYLLAALMIIFALAMVLSKNLVHSAVYMVVTFIGVAGIYVTLSADFLAAVQLLVYVGAISILLIFGIMLTPRGDIAASNLFSKHRWGSIIVGLGLFAILVRGIFQNEWFLSRGFVPESTVGPIADLMMNVFVIPFETAAILLLVAMLGAIIIGKGANENR